MLRVSRAQSEEVESGHAGHDLGQQLRAGLGGGVADAVIVFASSRHHYQALLEALEREASPGSLVGCSSAGEFGEGGPMTGTAVAIGLQSDAIRFQAGLGRGIRENYKQAIADAVRPFRGRRHPSRGKAALVLADSLAGCNEEVVLEMTMQTAGAYQLFGGGAGDDGKFSSTEVFFGTKSYSDALVTLELLSDKPIGIGAAHGWSPRSRPLRVTEAQGANVKSLDAVPAIDVYKDYSESVGGALNVADPLPFFLHHVLGVRDGDRHRVRVPLFALEDGSIQCAADVPQNVSVCIMQASVQSAVAAAEQAAREALVHLGDAQPGAALFFDCVATRLRLGDHFGQELTAVRELLGDATMVGINTYGQIVRLASQFDGFHNCTAVVCVLPK